MCFKQLVVGHAICGRRKNSGTYCLEDLSVIYEAFMYIRNFMPGDLGNSHRGEDNMVVTQCDKRLFSFGGKEEYTVFSVLLLTVRKNHRCTLHIS